jgi:hypothetical protein
MTATVIKVNDRCTFILPGLTPLTLIWVNAYWNENERLGGEVCSLLGRYRAALFIAEAEAIRACEVEHGRNLMQEQDNH